MGLTVKQVEAAKGNGKRQKFGDGDNLWLYVDKAGNKSWVLKYTSPVGKEREMGIGPERDISLAEARDKRDEARKLIRDGVDPIEARKEKRDAARVEAAKGITFEAYAGKYITAREAGWKNPVHRKQWPASLKAHAFPIIGALAVADVDTVAVLKVLRPIWTELPETARRVRGRIEAILNGAKAEGLRTGENPALWRGHLDQILAKRRKADVVHHAALPYAEMPRFWKSLAKDTSDAAGLLRFIILTASRYNEAAGWKEVEVKGDVWMIPAPRMKAGRAHAVPLTSAALACMPVPSVSDVALASCIKRHTKTHATTHGFRSTFRDWVGDELDFSGDLAEQALAHVLPNQTEAAYRRGTALQKRRALMQAWADFCIGKHRT